MSIITSFRETVRQAGLAAMQNDRQVWWQGRGFLESSYTYVNVTGVTYRLTEMAQNEDKPSQWAKLAREGHRIKQYWVNYEGSRLWLGVSVDDLFKPYPCTPADFGL